MKKTSTKRVSKRTKNRKYIESLKTLHALALSREIDITPLINKEMSGNRRKIKIPETAKKSSKYRQTGKSDRKRDQKLVAKLPGKRISASGNIYYERRTNRSDTPAQRKVAEMESKKKIKQKNDAMPIFVCNGHVQSAWRSRYTDFRRGNTPMPPKIKCLATGNTYIKDSPDWCRLRLNLKDHHCIWYRKRLPWI